MRARIHKNLNRDCWSRIVGKGPVSHVPAAALADVEFRVSEAARQKVIATRRRAVHAYAIGAEAPVPAATDGLVEVSYNPYKAGHFYRRDTGEAIRTARLVVFTDGGLCLADL